MEKTYAFIRQTLACILLFASTVAAAEIRPEVKVYEEPGWCVWCPSPVALPDGRFAHSKGGFLVGTYGTENVLVPWMRAFRALPAVKMSDCGGDDLVKLRTADFRGRRYFYALNTDSRERVVRFDFPDGTTDVLSGRRVSGADDLRLQPYELRSYVR